MKNMAALQPSLSFTAAETHPRPHLFQTTAAASSIVHRPKINFSPSRTLLPACSPPPVSEPTPVLHNLQRLLVKFRIHFKLPASPRHTYHYTSPFPVPIFPGNLLPFFSFQLLSICKASSAIYSPLQKHWNGKANSLVSVVHRRHLSPRSFGFK